MSVAIFFSNYMVILLDIKEQYTRWLEPKSQISVLKKAISFNPSYTQIVFDKYLINL